MNFASTVFRVNELSKQMNFPISSFQCNSFIATISGPGILLRWTVMHGNEIAEYRVQRSSDQLTWTEIGSLAGGCREVAVAQYKFVDEEPVPGINYYRISISGKAEPAYSELRTVVFEKDARSFSVESNIVSNCLIKLRIRKGVNLVIYSADGSVLHKSRYAPGTQIIEVAKSARGVCWLDGDGQVEKIHVD